MNPPGFAWTVCRAAWGGTIEQSRRSLALAGFHLLSRMLEAIFSLTLSYLTLALSVYGEG
jgi:hypothetical protein